jgi:hypothetical protein
MTSVGEEGFEPRMRGFVFSSKVLIHLFWWSPRDPCRRWYSHTADRPCSTHFRSLGWARLGKDRTCKQIPWKSQWRLRLAVGSRSLRCLETTSVAILVNSPSLRTDWDILLVLNLIILVWLNYFKLPAGLRRQVPRSPQSQSNRQCPIHEWANQH